MGPPLDTWNFECQTHPNAVYLHIRGLLVDRVFGLDFVKCAPSVKQNLPDVVDIPLPLVEAAAKVKLVR